MLSVSVLPKQYVDLQPGSLRFYMLSVSVLPKRRCRWHGTSPWILHAQRKRASETQAERGAHCAGFYMMGAAIASWRVLWMRPKKKPPNMAGGVVAFH